MDRKPLSFLSGIQVHYLEIEHRLMHSVADYVMYSAIVIPAYAGIQKSLLGMMMEKRFYVYILASKRNGTLYLGVTSDIVKRTWQHKNNLVEGFTRRYGVNKLVYYEIYKDAESAIKREKQLKKWKRVWKLELIEEKNSEWRDLYPDICQ